MYLPWMGSYNSLNPSDCEYKGRAPSFEKSSYCVLIAQPNALASMRAHLSLPTLEMEMAGWTRPLSSGRTMVGSSISQADNNMLMMSIRIGNALLGTCEETLIGEDHSFWLSGSVDWLLDRRQPFPVRPNKTDWQEQCWAQTVGYSFKMGRSILRGPCFWRKFSALVLLWLETYDLQRIGGRKRDYRTYHCSWWVWYWQGSLQCCSSQRWEYYIIRGNDLFHRRLEHHRSNFAREHRNWGRYFHRWYCYTSNSDNCMNIIYDESEEVVYIRLTIYNHNQ